MNQIHSESELNAEFGFSCEFCLILLLACRIKWSDAPGRPVSHMDSPTIDKADKWTSLTEIKIRCFCKENHFTWIEGHRFSKRGIWEREREWGVGKRCSPVRDCSLFDFARCMIDYLWKVLWKFTDGLRVQANWDGRLDPKSNLFPNPRVMKLTAAYMK